MTFEACVLLGALSLDAFSLETKMVMPPKLQVWRLLSSAFFHVGILHILFNMVSHLSLGSSLELRLGTFRFLCATLTLLLSSSSIYVAVCLAISKMSPYWLSYSSVGYSGVLFSYASIETFLPASSPTRSVFGLFSVPTKWYPWILMIVLQIMLPGVSFLGHLTGILSGVLYGMGCLQFFVPGSAIVASIENGRTARFECLANCIRRLPNYAMCPLSHDERETASHARNSQFAAKSVSLSNHKWPESGGHILGRSNNRISNHDSVVVRMSENSPDSKLGDVQNAKDAGGKQLRLDDSCTDPGGEDYESEDVPLLEHSKLESEFENEH